MGKSNIYSSYRDKTDKKKRSFFLSAGIIPMKMMYYSVKGFSKLYIASLKKFPKFTVLLTSASLLLGGAMYSTTTSRDVRGYVKDPTTITDAFNVKKRTNMFASELGFAVNPKYLRSSEDGLKRIAQHEGKSLKVYVDQTGKRHIGYGHLIKPEENFPDDVSITETEALDLLYEDLQIAENVIRDKVKVNLTKEQFDALTSFSYNTGTKAFAKSRILKHLNKEDFLSAADEFAKWNKITSPKTGKKVLDDGVMRRRIREGHQIQQTALFTFPWGSR